MGFDFSIFNEEQKEAITHENGPLLIVAGAGTGKTHVITSRILYLILEKQVRPENILALTFTEKAANEMLDRVLKALPYGYGECRISTFHSFCDAVLRERGHEIGLSTDYKLLTEPDQWLLMKKHLFRFELAYYRPLGNPQKFLSMLLKHFSRLKDEDIRPRAYKEYSESFLERAATDEEKEQASKTAELAKCYEEYQELLISENSLDYGDLIIYTLRLFEKRKSVLQEYQKRFAHVLVDEFQDTNYAQNKLILSLVGKNVESNQTAGRSLVVVGDDDQAIYKWRGASVVNILNFEKNFPTAKKIVLSKNYRSKQQILDVSYHIIRENNPHRLEVDLGIPKKLVAINKGTGQISIHHFSHYAAETLFVAQTIEELLAAGKQDCAILVRANSHARPFIEELRKRRIPYQYLAEESLFSQPVIKDIVSLLKFIADPEDDISLFRILSLPVWGFEMEELLSLNKRVKREHRSLYNIFSSLDSERAKSIQTLLQNLLRFSREHPPSFLVSTFLDSPYGKTIVSEEGFTAGDPLQKLADFSEKIREFELTHPETKTTEFVEYIKLLEQAGEAKGYQKELDRDLPKILTVHSAKGLEFDTVFLVNLVKDRFPSTSRREPLEIPRELIPEKLPEGDHHMEEERRLFYVGLTRAREKVFLSWSDMYEGKKIWKPSPFVLQSEEYLKKAEKKPQIHNVTSPQKEETRVHRPLASKTVALSTLSYSQIDTFQTCPLKYQFRYILNLPSLPSSALNYGISLHNTLREFYTALKQRTFAGMELHIASLEYEVYLKLLRQYFEKNWIPWGYDSKEHAQLRYETGWKAMETFFGDFMETVKLASGKARLPTYLEQSFRLFLGKVCIEGRIDRIDKLADGTFEVIDYKTGSLDNKPRLENDLQLSLYALACREALSIPVSKLTLWFLDANEKISTTRSDKELDAVKKELLENIQELLETDFPATPGHHCGYCDYRGICDYATVSIR